MAFNIIGDDIQSLSLEQLTMNYSEDRDTNKVTAWRDMLQVRPEYQRQFVYDEKHQKAVIYSILNHKPLGIMYFAKDGKNFEVMDGQQRIISICKFYRGEFSIDWKDNVRTYDNLSSEDKKAFDNYKIKYYECEGDYQGKIDWFKTINVNGEPLNNQEIRNALCGGEWIKTLKRYFSSKEYLTPYKELLPNFSREDTDNLKRFLILEKILGWLIEYEGFTPDTEVKDTVAAFMEKYKNSGEQQAAKHVQAFETICDFAKSKFNTSDKTYQRFLKFQTINWGKLARIGTTKKPDVIKAEIDSLLNNTEISKWGNVCEYIISGDKRILYNRLFSDDQKRLIWIKQGGRCGNKKCLNPNVPLADCQAHHKVAFDDGGATTVANGVILCKVCHKAWHNKDNSNFEFI